MILETLVDLLGQELNMKDLISSNEGAFTIPFEENILVEIKPMSKSYLFKGIIGPIPSSNKGAFFLKLMQANLFGRVNRGASVGLSTGGNMLTLSAELDYNGTYKEFKEKLEDFVSVLDFWREESQKHQ